MAVEVAVAVGVGVGVSVGVNVGVPVAVAVTVGLGVGVSVGVRVGVMVEVAGGIGVGVLVAVTVGVRVGVAVGGVALHIVMVLVSSVTVALRARTLPLTLEPPATVMLVRAIMFPEKDVLAARAAELPTCHHTSQANAPPVSVSEAPAVVASELPIWKMYVRAPLRTRSPVNCAAAPKQ